MSNYEIMWVSLILTTVLGLTGLALQAALIARDYQQGNLNWWLPRTWWTVIICLQVSAICTFPFLYWWSTP